MSENLSNFLRFGAKCVAIGSVPVLVITGIILFVDYIHAEYPQLALQAGRGVMLIVMFLMLSGFVGAIILDEWGK